MEFVLNLEKKNLNRCCPSHSLIEDIVCRLFRNEDTSKPGFVLFPRMKETFSTKERAGRFQHNVMRSLKDYLILNYPEFLTPNFMDLHHPDTEAIHKQSTLFVEPLYVDGLDNNVKMLHMDSLKRVIVSIMYGPFANITGGNPRLFDTLKYVQESGKSMCDIQRYVHEREYSCTSVSLGYHPDELFMLLQQQKDSDYRKFLTTFTDFDYSQYPLLIFSNRPEDGIMHGATVSRKIDPDKRSCRSLNYVALSYKIPNHFLR